MSFPISTIWGVIVPVPGPLLRLLSQVVDRVSCFRMALPSISRERVCEILPHGWVVASEEFCRSFRWEPEEPLPTVLKVTHDWYCRSEEPKPVRWLGLKALRHYRVGDVRSIGKRVGRLARVMGLEATLPGPHTSRVHPRRRIDRNC